MNKIEKININGFDIRMYKSSNNKIMMRSSDLSYAITEKHGSLLNSSWFSNGEFEFIDSAKFVSLNSFISKKNFLNTSIYLKSFQKVVNELIEKFDFKNTFELTSQSTAESNNIETTNIIDVKVSISKHFQDKEIRVIPRQPEPYFVLTDLCNVLEIKNARVSNFPFLAMTGVDTVAIYLGKKIDGRNNIQQMTIVSLGNALRIIARSRKPEAEKLERWIFDDVMTKVVLTGEYKDESQPLIKVSTNKLVIEPLKDSQGNLNVGALVQTTKACVELAEVFKLQGNQVLLSADSMTKKLTGVSPMALLDIKHLKNEAQELALNVTDIGSMLGLSAIQTNKILIEMGYQNRLRDNSSGCVYEPTITGKEYAVLMDTQRRHSNGRPILQLMWNKSVIVPIQNHLKMQGLYVDRRNNSTGSRTSC